MLAACKPHSAPLMWSVFLSNSSRNFFIQEKHFVQMCSVVDESPLFNFFCIQVIHKNLKDVGMECQKARKQG